MSDNLVTVQLDWKSAGLVASACRTVAACEATDGNDARVLELASAAIAQAAMEIRGIGYLTNPDTQPSPEAHPTPHGQTPKPPPAPDRASSR